MYQLSTRAEPDRRTSPLARWGDLLLVWLAAAVVAVLDLAWPGTPGWWRGLVGVPFGLVAPGYTVAAAVFPKHTDLDLPARAALTLVLSVGVTGGVVFLLSQARVPVTAATNLGGLGLVMGGATAAAAVRRERLAPSPRVTHLGPIGPLLVLVLAIALGTALVVVPAWQQRSPAAWITGPKGSGLVYPYEVTPSSPATVTLHVDNPSPSKIDYRLVGRLDGRTVLRRWLTVLPGRTVTTSVHLPDQADGQARFTLTLTSPGAPALTRRLVLHYAGTATSAG